MQNQSSANHQSNGYFDDSYRGQKHLAVASVPVQPWPRQLYDREQALKIGTVFPELNKPFFAAENQPGAIPPMAGNCGHDKDLEQEERERLLSRLNAVSFALDDVVLFLDTHPQETQAAELRVQLLQEKKALRQTFAENFYPLTKECEGVWGEGPMPWEGACI